MNIVDEIKDLLDQGDYLKAARLAEENKITDCRKICEHLDEINDIASSIDHSISILTSLEEKVIGYESTLRNIKDTAFQMEEREHAVEIQCKNISDASELIETLLNNLKISHDIQKTLLYDNLEENSDIEKFVSVLHSLEAVLNYSPDPSLLTMRCVKTQKEHAFNIKTKFCERFYQHFLNYLNHFFSQSSEDLINNIYSHPFSLPTHKVIHTPLNYMVPFMNWLAKNDKSTFEGLNNNYISRSKTQYDKEIRIFFDCAKEKLSDSHSDTFDTASGRSYDVGNWDEFDTNVDKILQALEPVCQAEQEFYTRLFAINGGDEANLKTLVNMFHSIETEFVEFTNYYTQQNGLYSLYIIVKLSQYLKSCNDTIFLKEIYPEVLLRVQKNFDAFMELQLNSIRESKAPKQPKCGVLSAVKGFEQLARQMESLFKCVRARSDIDKWYCDLVSELFKLIDGMEHSKTPTEMICLENYYYLHDVLRSLKVPCLEGQKIEANLQYKAALNAYVSRYFGRPLEKVNVFFEGVQSKIAQGVKEEEISFQLAFSKQELRKVLQIVTLKEVRKGLEDMYRRVEKHAFEPDSNLLQVIWREMQDEFLIQYKAIQSMIERCYPSSNLSLPFSIDDLLQVFSDIAQTH